MQRLREVSRAQWSKLGLRRRLESVLGIYEDLIGVSQVKESHQALLQAERRFVESQTERRRAQSTLSGVQEKVRAVRFQLDRTPRGEDNYLELVKEEIELVRQEKTTREIFEREEKAEREHFTQLSTCLRASYEKERAQGEKTKPLFLIMSVLGGLVGAGASALSSQAKIRQLKQMILDTSEANTAVAVQSLREAVTEVMEAEAAALLLTIRTSIAEGDQRQPPLHPSPSTPSVQTSLSESFSIAHVQSASLLAILLLLLYQSWNK